MKKYSLYKRSSAGFTMIELLVVVVLIGVLAAISAPSWLAFMNRQRIGRSSEQIVQALRAAQAEAKRTNTYREVQFDTTVDPPRYAVVPTKTSFDTGNAVLKIESSGTAANWEVFGQGEIKSGFMAMAENNPNGNSIIFGPKGEVVRKNLASTNPDLSDLPFVVTLSLKKAPTVKRCVRVQTILGAISQGEGTACP